jgi:hypothetical protein
MVKNAHERIRYVLTKRIVSISQEAASAIAAPGWPSLWRFRKQRDLDRMLVNLFG